MRIHRIICLILLITAISLFYVWQRVEIIKLAYQKQKKLNTQARLLDQNMVLRYNLVTLASFTNLDKSLGIFDTDYEMPRFSQIVDLRNRQGLGQLELASNLESKQAPLQDTKKPSIFLRIFSPRSQAEAQDRK